MPGAGKYAAFYRMDGKPSDYERLLIASANIPSTHPINLWQPRSRAGTFHNPLLTSMDLFVWFYLRRQRGTFYLDSSFDAESLVYPLKKTDIYFVRRLYRLGCTVIGDYDTEEHSFRTIVKSYTRGVPAGIDREEVSAVHVPSHQMPHQRRDFFYPWWFIGSTWGKYELERCVARRDVIDLTILDIVDDEVVLGTFPLPKDANPKDLRDEIALDLGNGFDLLPMCDTFSGRCLQTVAISDKGVIRGAFDRRFASPSAGMNPIYDVRDTPWTAFIEDLGLTI